MQQSSGPMPPKENEVIGHRSIFKWCPNRHIHGIKLMHSIHEEAVNSWGKQYNWHWGWICMSCYLREYSYGQ